MLLTEFAIRKTDISDLPELERIYDTARRFMRDHGNLYQWIGYPTEELLKHDIESSVSYVVTYGGNVCGTFAFFTSPDPTYAVIEDGNWLNDEKYGTVHRVASDGTHKGVLAFVMDHCSGIIDNIRIDTHADNTVMQNALSKLGFEKCGIIHLADGSPRIAYQKVFIK